ncbi:glycosyltransferase family 4 protein [Nanoarchaeota archaeon]
MPNSRILMILGYYFPYISGISEYVKRLSEELVKRGHKVTVLTSNHSDKLPNKELISGVEVIRCNPLLKVSKGLIMPSFISKGKKLSKKYDIVNIHLPLFEAAFFKKLNNSIITYHCDLKLNNKIIERLYYLSAKNAIKNSKKIITYTEDYASHSRLLKKRLKKCIYTYPPIDHNHFKYKKSNFKRNYNIEGPVIGFAGRLVYEKGLPFLLKSIPKIKQRYPDAKFVLAGEYKNVAGGSVIKKLDLKNKDIILLGNVKYDKLPEFYSSCDILVLPSIDPLEAFGIVQIEAMLCGTPVIATDLPGVRMPILKTGMGKIVKRKNPDDIAQAVISILGNKKGYIRKRSDIIREFNIEKTVDFYEQIFQGKNL